MYVCCVNILTVAFYHVPVSDKETSRQTNTETDKLKQTDMNAGKQTDRHTVRQADIHRGRQSDRKIHNIERDE